MHEWPILQIERAIIFKFSLRSCEISKIISIITHSQTIDVFKNAPFKMIMQFFILACTPRCIALFCRKNFFIFFNFLITGALERNKFLIISR